MKKGNNLIALLVIVIVFIVFFTRESQETAISGFFEDSYGNESIELRNDFTFVHVFTDFLGNRVNNVGKFRVATEEWGDNEASLIFLGYKNSFMYDQERKIEIAVTHHKVYGQGVLEKKPRVKFANASIGRDYSLNIFGNGDYELIETGRKSNGYAGDLLMNSDSKLKSQRAEYFLYYFKTLIESNYVDLKKYNLSNVSLPIYKNATPVSLLRYPLGYVELCYYSGFSPEEDKCFTKIKGVGD